MVGQALVVADTVEVELRRRPRSALRRYPPLRGDPAIEVAKIGLLGTILAALISFGGIALTHESPPVLLRLR
jgi:hypothetical protein